MKKLILSALLFTATLTFALPKTGNKVEKTAVKEAVQQEKEALPKPYDELEDADAKLTKLIAQAKKEGKNVFVQAGGNWCIWCLRFNDFVQKDKDIKTIVDKNFVYYHLNYTAKNKNAKAFEKYAPEGQKLGYPFFIVINGQGKTTNVIASGDLESGKSYDVAKVKKLFLDNVAKK
ncbi:thioredoxin family protein [Myroides sp. N17-2]|uniref:thioredoxin family protein n=1 Tax=Myroides sp. N17-2 TaxID=2030799 RepID=UPI000EFB102D|nr:thioredoxin family protein [Myroides sp. N17-2]